MGPEEARGGRRLAAIFAADVAGYSRLMGQDEAGTLRALTTARATLSRFIAEYGGRLVNTVGDSVLAEFPSAVDAVKCAIVVQETLAQASAESTEGPRLSFRIAVHVGDVIPSGGDIFGDGINVCARLQEIAEPRGICISGAAYHYVRKALPVAFDDLGERTLKNIDEPVRVFAIRAAQGAGHSPPPPKPSAVPKHQPAKKSTLNWMLAGGLVAAMAVFLLYQLATQSGTTTARQEPVSPAGGIAIAVLPFTNLSGDPAQEFFSDGMSDEIMTALARIPSLQVVARASAFQFKGQNRDIRAISQALHARYVIDGSVRRAGNRVRIAAQLIQADNGVNIWADSFDRELTDVFAIQEDIALAIAGALRLPLGLRQGERLVSNRTSDLDSYQQYLRARTLFRARAVDEAIAQLEEVVARDPTYAPALALSARVYALVPNYDPFYQTGAPEEARRSVLLLLDKAEMAAREAIRLDAMHSGGYAGLADIQVLRKRLTAAEDLYRQALALDPNDADTLDRYSRMLAAAGRLKESLRLREQIRALEPFVPIYNLVTAAIMLTGGERQAAIRMLDTMAPSVGTGYVRNSYLASGYAAEGRFAEAADTLLAMPPQQKLLSRQAIEDAARLLRSTPAKVIAPDALPELERLNWVYMYVGASNRVLERYEREIDVGYMSSTSLFMLWESLSAPVRKTERFKALMRNAGLVAYWHERGWPDLCRPMGTDDFVCD